MSGDLAHSHNPYNPRNRSGIVRVRLGYSFVASGVETYVWDEPGAGMRPRSAKYITRKELTQFISHKVSLALRSGRPSCSRRPPSARGEFLSRTDPGIRR